MGVSMEHCCDDAGSRALEYPECSVTVLITKLTRTDPVMKLGVCGEIQAASRVIGRSIERMQERLKPFDRQSETAY
jgi:hypothetical protein